MAQEVAPDYKVEFDIPKFLRQQNKAKLEKACKYGDVFLSKVYKEADSEGPQRTLAFSLDYKNCFVRVINKRSSGVRGDLRDYTDWFIEKSPNTRGDKGEKAQTTWINIKQQIIPSDSLLRDYNNGVELGEKDLRKIAKWELIKPYYERWLEAKNFSSLVMTIAEYKKRATEMGHEHYLGAPDDNTLVYACNDQGKTLLSDLSRHDYIKDKHAKSAAEMFTLGDPGENLTEKVCKAAGEFEALIQKQDKIERGIEAEDIDEKDAYIKHLEEQVAVATGKKVERKNFLGNNLDASQIPLDAFNTEDVIDDGKEMKKQSEEPKKIVTDKVLNKTPNVPKAQKPTNTPDKQNNNKGISGMEINM